MAYMQHQDIMSTTSDAPSVDSTTSAPQYWRDLCTGLQLFSQFEGCSNPHDIISRLNDLVSNVDRLTQQVRVLTHLMQQKDQDIQDKDGRIDKLQKQNTSLSTMLQEQASASTTIEKRGSLQRSSGRSDSSASASNNQEQMTSEQKESVEDLQKKYSQLVESKNTLYGHWKTVKEERDTYENKLEHTQAECERLKQKAKVLEGIGGGVKSNAVGDKEVVLRRDENGRCGIRFGCPKKTPLLMESNTIVTDIRDGIANKNELNIGDYVIEINNFNIQWMKLRDVLELVNNSGDLKLKLRPSRHNMLRTEKMLSAHKTQGEWGLTFGVFVKETRSGSFADISGMHEMDELLKVNSDDVYGLSLKKIYNAMNKDVKFKFQKLQNPYEQIYDEIPATPTRISTTTYSSPSNADGSGGSGGSAAELRRQSVEISTVPPTGAQRTLERTSDLSGSSARSSSRSVGSDAMIPPAAADPQTNPPFPSDGSGEGESSGGPSVDEVRKPLHGQDVITCTVVKETYQTFGWTMIGGNKVGIYVKSIDNWSPIEKAGIAVGWQVVQINNTSWENVAFSFAMDFMASLRQSTSITVHLKKVSPEHYRSQISQKPYDSFHVRTIAEYKKKSSDEVSFKVGEVFNVTDSYYINDSNVLKWLAKSASQTVTIPSQKASLVLSSEADAGQYMRRGAQQVARYYVILDRVDIEADGANQLDEDEDEADF